MRFRPRHALYALAAAGWAAAVAHGAWGLWKYSSAAGVAAVAPESWPGATSIQRENDRPTLVMLLHPHCPCSRATVGELAKLMAVCQGRMNVTVLLLRPANMPEGWEQTDLWRTAQAIPGVRVIADADGRAAHLFGSATSGQALLYSADGRLLFSGGITESRGHAGDNAGAAAIQAIVLHPDVHINSKTLRTPVYGCPLFEGGSTCRK